MHDSMRIERQKREGRNRGNVVVRGKLPSGLAAVPADGTSAKTFSYPEHLHSTTSTLSSVMSKKVGLYQHFKCEPCVKLLRLAVFSGTAESKSGRVGGKLNTGIVSVSCLASTKDWRLFSLSLPLLPIRQFCLFQHSQKKIKKIKKAPSYFFTTFVQIFFFHPA